VADSSNLKWFTNVKMRSFRKKRLRLQKKTARKLERNHRAEQRAVVIIVYRKMRKKRNLLNSHLLMKNSVLDTGEDPRRRECMLL
jgi:hypothetical protein